MENFENFKYITLVNKLHETAITLCVPSYVYTNYVLTGDKTEIDWWLKELAIKNPKLFEKTKNILCPHGGIGCICELYQETIVDESDQKFMQVKERELQTLMQETWGTR